MKEMYSRFSRAVDTRVNKVRGSGLGLSIVKEIVDIMGGTIEVESLEQKGTTFRVILEVAYTSENEKDEGVRENGNAAGAEKAVRQTEYQSEDSSFELPEGGLKLLVAEDNDLNYEILDEQLKMYNIRCVRAADGRECVQKFESAAPGTFDAVLMDMQMPVMNGLEATQAIRGLLDEEAQSIPIIALTANAYQEDVKKCLKAGMNTHLSKPIDIQLLLQTILRYVE